MLSWCKSAVSNQFFSNLLWNFDFLFWIARLNSNNLLQICHIHRNSKTPHFESIEFRPHMVFGICLINVNATRAWIPTPMLWVDALLQIWCVHSTFSNSIFFFFQIARLKSDSLGLMWFLESALAMWMLLELEFQPSWRSLVDALLQICRIHSRARPNSQNLVQ